VIYLTDPLDELTIQAIGDFDGKVRKKDIRKGFVLLSF
jgi:hypothetical protein